MKGIIIILLTIIFTVCSVQAANLTYDNFCIDNKISTNEEATINKIINSVYTGYTAQAINICNSKLNADSSRPTYYLFRGFAQMKQDNFKSAISDLTTAIKKDSNFSVMSYYLRALCYFTQNDYTNGFKDLDKALSMLNSLPKTNPNMPPKGEQYVWHYKISDNYHSVSYLINRAYINYAKKYIVNELNKARANSLYTLDSNKLNKMYERMIVASETMSKDRSEIRDSEIVIKLDEPIYFSDIRNDLDVFASEKSFNNSGDGIDWDSYMAVVQNKIKQVWEPAPNQSRRAIAQFSISRNGEVSNIRIITSSGSEHGDRRAINAIKQAAPFRPLPSNYKNDHVDIQFTFTPSM